MSSEEIGLRALALDAAVRAGVIKGWGMVTKDEVSNVRIPLIGVGEIYLDIPAPRIAEFLSRRARSESKCMFSSKGEARSWMDFLDSLGALAESMAWWEVPPPNGIP